MKIPTQLKHKPVIISDEYNKIDGRYAGKSDIVALSLGLAQINTRGGMENSAKIWRHTGKKWSSVSEELPFHRVLDLAILICKSKLHFQKRHEKNEKDSPQYPLLERVGVQGGAMNVAVCEDNEFLEKDMQLFDSLLHKDDEILSERINHLFGVLKELQEL
ncbi:MAG: DUF6530 family protein [Candidatus Gracilibacteria bacterium]|nr:DUF6530 family protein [Candidatus Gracilibacteria bacterium]